MQSTIDGDKLALSRQLRTSSYLLAMEWTQAQPTSTQRRNRKEKAEREGERSSPWLRRKQMHNTGIDRV